MSWFSNLFRSAPEPDAACPMLPAGSDNFLPGGHEKAFHASATVGQELRATNEMVFRSGCGFSQVSVAEAKQLAREQAQRHLAAALGGLSSPGESYDYAVQRRHEPVVEALALPGTETKAQVTINSYGALIINARTVLFADVDTREDWSDSEEAGANEKAAAQLRSVLEHNPKLGFRVYRTRNGWRYLCTSRLFDPVADETRHLLQALGADEKFVLLCRVQRCFRARLTPKPWRIGHRFYQVHPAERVSRSRIEKYLKKAAPFATTNFTAEVGQSGVSPAEVQLIIEHHDRWCAAHSGKPLA